MSDYTTTLLFGEKKLDPIRVWVETRYKKRKWWWGEKTVYYVCTDYMSWGPCANEEDAWDKAHDLQLTLRK